MCMLFVMADFKIVSLTGFRVSMETYPWVCLRETLERVNVGGKTYYKCGQHSTMGWDLWLNKNWAEQQHLLLSASWLQTQRSPPLLACFLHPSLNYEPNKHLSHQLQRNSLTHLIHTFQMSYVTCFLNLTCFCLLKIFAWLRNRRLLLHSRDAFKNH